MKQYAAETASDGPSKKNEEPIEVGKGTKSPSLHGKHTLENKRKFGDNEPNQVALDENMAIEVRKAVVLDYLEGGGDGKGDMVMERTAQFKTANPELIDLVEPDDLYPTSPK